MGRTLVLVILDESDHMKGKRSTIIDNFNWFVEDLKFMKHDDAKFYMVTFNDQPTVRYRGESIDRVPSFPLSAINYHPWGKAALYDAVDRGIKMVQRDKQFDDRVLCVVIADGCDNASIWTSRNQLKYTIDVLEVRGDWKFMAVGENGLLHGIHYNSYYPRSTFDKLNDYVKSFRRSYPASSTSYRGTYYHNISY